MAYKTNTHFFLVPVLTATDCSRSNVFRWDLVHITEKTVAEIMENINQVQDYIIFW